jgi:DNA-binding winged helix-turn-helix (wHTH) protein
MGEAYPVPYGNQCTFIPGYRGLVKLARQSGEVKRIETNVVCEHDQFTFEEGSTFKLVFKRKLDGDRGKPRGAYALAELLTRIDALLRRARDAGTLASETRLVVEDLELDRLSRAITRAGQAIELKPQEYRLLEYLMQHAGQVVTRTMLLEGVWDYHFDPQTNVIDVHISRLRAKLEPPGSTPLIHTIRGAGYRLGGQ